MGPVMSKSTARPALERPAAQVDDSQVRCFDPEAEAAMVAEIKAAAKVGDSLGGVARSSATASRSGSAATCTGTAGSRACWPRPS